MALIKLCNPQIAVDIESLERRVSALENGAVKPIKTISKPAPVIKEEPVTETCEEPQDDEIPLPEPPIDDAESPQPKPQKVETDSDISAVDNWDEILTILKSSCPLIAGVLGDSKAYIKGDYLLIDSKNSQFRTLIKTANGIYKDHIRKAAEQVLGATYKLGPYNTEKQTRAQDPLLSLADKLKNLDIN